MTELTQGSLVICGDLLGFAKTISTDTVILNTVDGDKTVTRKACVVMATPQELAKSTCLHLRKQVASNAV